MWGYQPGVYKLGWVCAVLLGWEFSVQAADTPFTVFLANPLGFLTPSLTGATIKMVGLALDYRPLEPATPLGAKVGIDVSASADVIQIPASFMKSLSQEGFPVGGFSFFPSFRQINLHKGVTDSIDVGGSYLSALGATIWAVDVKVVIYHPEEGLTWAIRLSRNSTDIPIGTATVLTSIFNLGVQTVTWTPALIVSKKLYFADPYLGLAYQYVTGAVHVEAAPGAMIALSSSTISATGGGALAFLGLSMRAPTLGLRVTLEGGYSSEGYHSISAKAGLSF